MTLGGFGFEERMSGHYTLSSAPAEERPFDFTMSARATNLVAFLKKPVARLDGEANLVGFADHQPAHGTVLLDLIPGRRIGYDFEFRGNDGQTYRFRGQKDVEVTRLSETMSTLPAGLYDATGGQIGEALLRFDYASDLFRFLRSWRLIG